jgi:hypothetical protein
MFNCLPKEQLSSLMSSFSIAEASCLVAGHPPSDYVYDEHREECYLNNQTIESRTVFDMALNSLKYDIEIGKLKALIKTSYMEELYRTDTQDDWRSKAVLDVFGTRVDRDNLIKWFEKRNCKPDFLFGNTSTPEYLKRNEYYAPKLASLIMAWEDARQASMENNLNGTVKQHIETWLTANAKSYGVDNKSDFSDISSIANFDPNGGRKPTPRNVKPTHTNTSIDSDDGVSDEKIIIMDDLLIQKNDLHANKMSNSGIRGAVDPYDDIPF